LGTTEDQACNPYHGVTDIDTRREFVADPVGFLRTQLKKCQDQPSGLEKLVDSPWLTAQERLLVTRRLACEGVHRQQFMSLWWLMSMNGIQIFEAWMEQERLALVSQLNNTPFLPGLDKAYWCEETLDTRAPSDGVLTNVKWRELEARLYWDVTTPTEPEGTSRKRKRKEQSLSHVQPRLIVSGFVPNETWNGVHVRHSSGRFQVRNRTKLASWISDLTVRMYKSRTLAWRHHLSTCPGVTRILQLAHDKLLFGDTWKRYFAHGTALYPSRGLPPLLLDKSYKGPLPVTSVTHVPTQCPAMADRTLPSTNFVTYSKQRGYATAEDKATLGHNASNLTGGIGCFPTTTEFLLERAFMSMTCTTGQNTWSQFKQKNKTCPTSRFSLDIDVELTGNEWMDPSVQYMPVLREWRVWEPLPAQRSTSLLLSNHFETTSLATVLARALIDLQVETPETLETVILTSSGRKPTSEPSPPVTVCSTGTSMVPLERACSFSPDLVFESIDNHKRDTQTETEDEVMMNVYHTSDQEHAVSTRHKAPEPVWQKSWGEQTRLFRKAHPSFKLNNTHPFSSFTMVFPSVETAIGDPQVCILQFCTHRLVETFGTMFASKRMDTILDKKPYSNNTGGGARFVFDDKCVEIICTSCQAKFDSGQSPYKPHANFCPMGECERHPEKRPKIPFLALDARTGQAVSELPWHALVTHASVWSQQTSDTKLLEVTLSKSLTWKRDKKLSQFMRSKLDLTDHRFREIQTLFQTQVWKRDTVKMEHLFIHQLDPLDKAPSFYSGTIKNRSVPCLNTGRIHKRQSFFHISLRYQDVRIDDFSCQEDRKLTRGKQSALASTRNTGISQLFFEPKRSSKVMRGPVIGTTRDGYEPFYHPLPETLFYVLFPR